MVNSLLVAGLLLSVVLTAPPAAHGQEGRVSKDDEREQAFADALRREDPAGADRYVELREARARAVADLRRAQNQYAAAGQELRAVFVGPLRTAERRYVEASLALLDFLEARDRHIVTKLHDEIGRINAILEQHRQTRADLEKMLRGQ